MQPELHGPTTSFPQQLSEIRRLRREIHQSLDGLREALIESQSILGQSGRSYASRRIPPRLGILDTLTAREVMVLRLIAEGKSTKELADELGIAFKTAVCHRSRILQKLGAHETASLVRLAIRAGLVEP